MKQKLFCRYSSVAVSEQTLHPPSSLPRVPRRVKWSASSSLMASYWRSTFRHWAPSVSPHLPSSFQTSQTSNLKASSAMNLTNGATSKTVLDRFMRLDIGASKKVHSTFLTIYHVLTKFLFNFRPNVCTSGSMDLAKESGPRPKLWILLLSFPLVCYIFRAKITFRLVMKIAKSFLLLHVRL